MSLLSKSGKRNSQCFYYKDTHKHFIIGVTTSDSELRSITRPYSSRGTYTVSESVTIPAIGLLELTTYGWSRCKQHSNRVMGTAHPQTQTVRLWEDDLYCNHCFRYCTTISSDRLSPLPFLRQINLSWSASTDNVVAGYKIYSGSQTQQQARHHILIPAFQPQPNTAILWQPMIQQETNQAK